jgi:hypothetical protein
VRRSDSDDCCLNERSDVLDVIARKIAVVDVVHGGFGIASCASFLPVGLDCAGVVGNPEIDGGEAVELLQVFGAAFASEEFQHDEVLAVLEGGVLDVFDRLEEGRYFPGHLPLLLGLVAAYYEVYL